MLKKNMLMHSVRNHMAHGRIVPFEQLRDQSLMQALQRIFILSINEEKK